MPKYSDADLSAIAEAISRDTSDIARFIDRFRAAALWYELDCRSPRRTPPTTIRTKMQRIISSARRLLLALEVRRPEDADDGPGSVDILSALATVQGSSEDAVIEATRRVGRLAEILQAIEAAQDLERLAQQAANEEIELGALIVPKGHQGDAPVLHWMAAMMGIYRDITGREPRTSVSPNPKTRGCVGGPFVRFLNAAAMPLEIKRTPSQWRSMMRVLKRAGQRQKK